MYRDACAKKGIKVTSKGFGNTSQTQRTGARSAKVELLRRDAANVPELPKIEHPSMHPREKPITNYLE